jgi:hypothetical protein
MKECVKGNKIKIAPTGVGIPVKNLSGSSSRFLDDSSLILYRANLKQEKIMKIKQAKVPILLS